MIEPAPRNRRESGMPHTTGGWISLATLTITLAAGIICFLIGERDAGMLLLASSGGFAVGRASTGGK